MTMRATKDPGGRAPAAGADASMRLLHEIMEHPLDPAYADAARRRALGRPPRLPARLLTVLLAGACGWAVTYGAVTLRAGDAGTGTERARIEQRIRERATAAEALGRRVDTLRGAITSEESAQLAAQGEGALADRVRSLSAQVGELPVTGPGLEITLDDPATAEAVPGSVDPRAGSGTEGDRVLDHDVQVVVNGLWASGAEAVAVNGRRLTTVSAIRSAGRAILVDFHPLSPPYVVRAIGDPRQLRERFTVVSGTYVQTLEQRYGVRVGYAERPSLTLPAAGDVLLRSARPAGGGTVGASPAGTARSTLHPSSSSLAPGGPPSGSGTRPASPPEVSP